MKEDKVLEALRYFRIHATEEQKQKAIQQLEKDCQTDVKLKTDTNMYTFDIWMEGFRATGESASAHLVATNVKGENFIDACKQFYKNDSLFRINEDGTPSWWGCRLFNNEAEARKTFG